MADPPKEHPTEDTAKSGSAEAPPRNESSQPDTKGSGQATNDAPNSTGSDARPPDGTAGGLTGTPTTVPPPPGHGSDAAASQPTASADTAQNAAPPPAEPSASPPPGPVTTTTAPVPPGMPAATQPLVADSTRASRSGSIAGPDQKTTQRGDGLTTPVGHPAIKAGSRGSGGMASKKTHFRESQMPSGTPKEMYDSLLSDSNKRDVSKAKQSVQYITSHDSMDSPFCNLEDFKEFMYSYYTEGQSIIAHMRDRVPRDLPDVSLLLEMFFKRYIMLKLELDCYFSTVINYDADKIDKSELRFWPNQILKNMDENISWIMEQIRGRANLGEFYHDSLEQLKLLLYQMRAATVMYDWHNI